MGARPKTWRVKLADGTSYWLRPSVIAGSMTGTVDGLADPLLLAAQGVPPWLLTIGFGHGEIDWDRIIERLGRNRLVGSTVRDAARLPVPLAADGIRRDPGQAVGALRSVRRRAESDQVAVHHPRGSAPRPPRPRSACWLVGRMSAVVRRRDGASVRRGPQR